MSQPRLLSEHRLARLIAWLGAVLAWFALGAPRATGAQRRHRQRYGHLTIATPKRAVIDIIIIRAALLLPERAPIIHRDFASRGFRTPWRRPSRRAIGGVWLRRFLNRRGSFVAQVAQLLEALRHCRGLAAHLAWRRRRSLNRRSPIILAYQPQHAVRTLAAPDACATDSS